MTNGDIMAVLARKYEASVRQLIATIFKRPDSPEDDAKWSQWVHNSDDRREQLSHVLDLLYDPQVAPVFKARLLVLLLVPAYGLICFPDPHPLAGCSLPGGAAEMVDYDRLEPSVQFMAFVIELLTLNHTFVKEEVDQHEIPINRDVLFQYNDITLKLLGLVAPQSPLVGDMLQHYHLLYDADDHLAESSGDGCRGLRALLQADVPEFWKLQASQKLELMLRNDPHHALLAAYIAEVRWQLQQRRLAYSVGTLAAQVEHILTHADPHTELFREDLTQLLLLLTEEVEETRYKLVTHLVMKTVDPLEAMLTRSTFGYLKFLQLREEFGEDPILGPRLIELEIVIEAEQERAEEARGQAAKTRRNLL